MDSMLAFLKDDLIDPMLCNNCPDRLEAIHQSDPEGYFEILSSRRERTDLDQAAGLSESDFAVGGEPDGSSRRQNVSTPTRYYNCKFQSTFRRHCQKDKELFEPC